MSNSIGQRLRIISIWRCTASAESDDMNRYRTRAFDYARLLRRRASPHRPLEGARSDVVDGVNSLDHDALRNNEQDACPLPEFPHGVIDEGTAEHESMIRERMADAIGPLMSTVLMHDRQFINLFATLAREIAAFCSDPAISTSGYWHATLPLDPDVFSNTTLQLTLSPLALELRFDAFEPDSRELLLQHSTALQHELEALLRSWSQARSVKLMVW